MEKIWTVPELKAEVGQRYIKAILAKGASLTHSQIWNVLNGREAGTGVMEEVMKAAELAVAEARRMKAIKAQLGAHRKQPATPTSNAA